MTEWLAIKKGAKENAPPTKNVKKSGLLTLSKLSVDTTQRESTTIVYDSTGMWKGTFQHQGKSYDTLSVPRAATINQEGAPEIPQEGIFVAIPNNATNIKIKVLDKKMMKMPGKLRIKPAPKPITEEEYIAGKEKIEEKNTIYDSDNEFPGKDVELIGIKQIEGVPVAHILVYLAQYKPLSGSLSVVISMTIEISYDVPPQVDAIPKKRKISPVVSDLILDYQHLGEKKRENDYDANTIKANESQNDPVEETGSDGLSTDPSSTIQPSPTTDPGTDTSQPQLKRNDIICEYVIITNNLLKNSVAPLLQAKSGWPHYAIVATIETITAEFPAASLKESIKDFLSWAWDNWSGPPRYVVLAGDTDILPVHIWTIGGEQYASDHYYADINGTLAPEIIVSRIPTSDATKMQEICQHLANYENLRGPDWGTWKNEVVLVAYELDSYKTCSDNIAASISPRFNVKKLYGDNSTTQQVIDKMNNGVIIANYRGHGSKTDWGSNNGLDTTDIGNLTNKDKPPLVFCICCKNAWIDDTNAEVVVEKFIRDQKAVAVFGASRLSPTYANNDFNQYLFQAIMDGETCAGDIIYRAKTMMVLNHANSETHQQDVIMYMLIGDPAAKVVSNVEFLRGQWKMDHDGQKGTLEIDRIWNHSIERDDSCGYPVWNFSGKYTSQNKSYVMTGKIGGRDDNDENSGCKRTDHKVEFVIDFASDNKQKFLGYITTLTRDVMTGYTWWSNVPFGWYAIKS